MNTNMYVYCPVPQWFQLPMYDIPSICFPCVSASNDPFNCLNSKISLYKSNRMSVSEWVSEWVCVFICLLTHPKSYWAEILRDYFPSDADILGHRPFTKKSKKTTYNAGNNHSIKAIGCQWVSELVCLFVP